MDSQPNVQGDHAPGWVKPNRVLLSQAPVVVLLTIVALPILPLRNALIWSCLILGAALFEGYACSLAIRRPTPPHKALALGSTVLTSFFYAFAAAAVLGPRGDAGSRLFAVVLLASSMIYVLLRYYQRPWTFVAAIAPQIFVLSLVGVGLAMPLLKAGDYVAALTPVATTALLVLMFWAARTQLAASWRSIVERERAAAAANAAKSEFLATMSHEIRTPLNGVLGMAQAMTADDLAQVQRERLKVIRRSGEDLLAILNDVLDLSKIEAGVLELELSQFDIEHLARGAVATFAHQTHKKGVAFNFEIADAAKGQYLGDPSRVRQLIYNLTSNAVKFTDQGSITVRVADHGGGLMLVVADTGCGIAPDKMAELFDKFVQADSSATRRYGGAGLGLSICRELARLMGGDILVESAPGQGSTFTIALPDVVKISAVAPPTSASPATAQDVRAGELRVLAAEDNKVNQLVLKTLLAQAGIDPVIVENGARAVEAWEMQHWDVILMDIQMPEMDGVTAARLIRAREAETGRARTPILAVTANTMTHQTAEYGACGMDGVVAKPIEITALFAAMEKALDGPEETQGVVAA